MNNAVVVLNIDSDHINIAEIIHENGEKIVGKIEHLSLQTGQENREVYPAVFIRDHLRHESPGLKKAILIISSTDLDYREFTFPFDVSRKVANAIAFEISSEFPPDEYIFDYIESVERENGRKSYLAAMIHKETLRQRIQEAENANLQIIGITSDISTLGIFFQSEDPTLVMDVEERHTLFALYQSGIPMLVRGVPIGVQNLLKNKEANAETIAILVREIKRTIHSFSVKSGIQLKKIQLAGHLPGHKEILEKVKPALELDLIETPPMNAAFVANENQNTLNRYAGILGAADWRKSNRLFNFQKAEFARSDPRDSIRRYSRLGILLGLLLLVMIPLSSWLDIMILQKREAFLSAEIRKTFTQSFPDVTRIVDEVKQAENIVNKNSGKLSGPWLGGRITILDAMNLVSHAIPNETDFEIATVFWETGKVEINGSTDTFKSVNAIQERLSRITQFSDVAISNAKQTSDGQHVEFKITIRIAE